MSRRDTQEGWGAPRRLPLIVAAATLIVVTIGLILAGRFYLARIAPATRPPNLALPSPGLETVQTAPGERRDRRRPPPRGIDRAMAASARAGDALWSEGR